MNIKKSADKREFVEVSCLKKSLFELKTDRHVSFY